MKKVIAIAALTAATSSAFAQLAPLPGTEPGVSVNSIGANAGALYWENPLGLLAYKFASDDNLGAPKPSALDNGLGLSWASSYNGHVASILNKLNAEGGTIRAIFLGESAAWLNDFGYAYDGLPAGTQSYSVWNDIQANQLVPNPEFGAHINLDLQVGEASAFDFWLSASNSKSAVTQPPGSPGGYYTAFHPANGNPGTNNALWTQDALNVRNWTPGGDQWAATYLVGFEDWRLGSADKDYNDFMFAVQFFDKNGTPFSSVPEPSTYGLIGAAALLGLVARRRFSKK